VLGVPPGRHVHQPLHVAEPLTKDFPKAIAAARPATFVRPRRTRRSRCTSSGTTDHRQRGISNGQEQAIELRLRKEHAKDKLTELATTEFDQNCGQGEPGSGRRNTLYLDRQVEGSAKMGSAKALPDDYVKTMQPIAERRAVSRVIDCSGVAENISCRSAFQP